MRERTCCFTGHRRLSAAQQETIASRLEETVHELIQSGVVYFGTGGALGFDTLAALTVLRLREQFSHIKLILVLPCENQADGWGASEQAVYEEIKCRADKVVYISKEYTDDCMRRRNRHLVDHSRVCVCYMTQYGGGTGYTVQYAQKQGVRVINLA